MRVAAVIDVDGRVGSVEPSDAPTCDTPIDCVCHLHLSISTHNVSHRRIFTMFTTFLTISVATLGLLLNVNDSPIGKQTCCMKRAYCCWINASCCGKEVSANQSASATAAIASDEVAKPSCCIKHSYCCSVKRSCCPKTTAVSNAETTVDVAISEDAAIGKQTCCMKRAYCCSVNRPCCRSASAATEI